MIARSAYGAAPRQKYGPLALTIALHLIVAAILILYKSAPLPRQVEQSLSTFFVPDKQAEQAEAAKAQEKQQPKQRDSETPEEDKPTEPPPAPAPMPIVTAPGYLTMSSAEFAAADISRMPSYSQSRAKEGTGANSTTAYGPGEGPGGAQLYDPDWFREPTSAELGGYLTVNMPREGWGLIACQTIPRNRVENCRTLGEYPLGSGFGKAVRDAAWQFQILPPRINGKPVIGAWVRIRISYGTINEVG